MLADEQRPFSDIRGRRQVDMIFGPVLLIITIQVELLGEVGGPMRGWCHLLSVSRVSRCPRGVLS